MSDWEIWATIGVLAIATAATRSSFWLVGHHITIPKRVQEMLRYAPACALAGA
jgi:branched-subunit amino acid transport protein